MSFTEEEKFYIWLDYFITINALNLVPIEYVINDKPYQERVGKEGVTVYPLLGVFTQPILHKHKIKSFDVFCSDSSLNEWYWKFKERIFKNNLK